MSISSLVKHKSQTEPYNVNEVWVREFTNGQGQTVLLQLYSPSGGFTYPHRQLLGKLFSESYPKGYWVSRESFETALKRNNLHSAGKLKRNAWTLSALVNPKALQEPDFRNTYSHGQEEEIIASLEANLIDNLAREKDRIINAIKAEPGTENTKFHFIKVDLTDQSQPGYENQIAALGFFATNNPTLKAHHKKVAQHDQPVAASFTSDHLSVETQSSTALPFYMPSEATFDDTSFILPCP